MKFLLDACAASRTLRDGLSGLGHDVRWARGKLARASDEALLALAYEEGRVLVTEDKDFGELVFLRRLPHPCVVRLVELRVVEQLDALRDLIERHGQAYEWARSSWWQEGGCGYGRRVSGKRTMTEASDTSERGPERLICVVFAGHPCEPEQGGKVAEARLLTAGSAGPAATPPLRSGVLCRSGSALRVRGRDATGAAESLALDEDSPTRREFLARLQGEVSKRGTIDLLRHGIKNGAHELDEDAQVSFKAKAFVRTYGFLSCVLPYTNAEWEKCSIFLNFLISKLPAPEEEDLSKGILDAIDMDSYRVEKRAVQKIMPPDEDAEIEPVPASGGGHRPEPELDNLSNILNAFNDLFGDIAWQDRDPRGRAHHQDHPRPGGRGRRVPERPSELGRSQCPHRARQGAGPHRDRHGQGRRRAVQAVHRQRGLQALDDGWGVRAGL